MISRIRQSFSVLLALFLILYPAARASARTPTLKQPPTFPVSPSAAVRVNAPVPDQLLTARKVFIANGGGPNYFDAFTGGPDRGYNTLYAELSRSGLYRIVSSPSLADVVLQINSIAPLESTGADDDNLYPNPQLILSVRDPQTNAVLWTTTANVRVLGTQRRRDRQFDSCVSVLVDKLAQTTGHPLTPAQLKAVHANSHIPLAAKIFFSILILGSFAFIAFGIYQVTHPPTLTPPTLPAFP